MGREPVKVSVEMGECELEHRNQRWVLTAPAKTLAAPSSDERVAQLATVRAAYGDLGVRVRFGEGAFVRFWDDVGGELVATTDLEVVLATVEA